MKKCEVVVNVKDDRDASPIAFLVQTASQFDSRIYIDCEEKHVNAKSIMGIFSLDLSKPIDLNIHASDNMDEILKALEPYII